MDATTDYHTKGSKSERGRQLLYVITYMWNQKYDTNEPIYGTETESWCGCQSGGRLVVAKGEGVGGGMEWEVAVSRCKLS